MPSDPWDDAPAQADPWDEPAETHVPGALREEAPTLAEDAPEAIRRVEDDSPGVQTLTDKGTPKGRIEILLQSVKAGALGFGQGAALGFADELAAVPMALGDKMAQAAGYLPERPQATLGDFYRDARQYAQQEHARASDENPWTYGLSQAAGGIASMPMLPGGMGAAKAGLGALAKQGAAGAAIAGLGHSTADLTQGEVGGAALDVGANAALGGALGAGVPAAAQALKNPIAQAGRAVGGALQVPQRAYEAVAERVGQNELVKRLTPAADVAGKFASAKVKQLRDIIDNSRLGTKMAGAFQEATAKLGGIADKFVSEMTPAEREQIAGGFADLLKTRGLTSATKEYVLNNFDKLAGSAGLELDGVTGKQFLHLANKRDVQWWVSAGEGVRDFWDGLLVGEQDVRAQAQLAANRDLAEAFKRQEMDRLGRPMGGGGPGTYQNSNATVERSAQAPRPETPQAKATRFVKTEDQKYQELREATRLKEQQGKLTPLEQGADPNATNPAIRRDGQPMKPKSEYLTAQERVDQRQQAYQARQDAGYYRDQMQSVNQNVVARGGPTNPADAGADMRQQIAQPSVAKLGNIATGRRFMEGIAAPVVGGALAGGAGGVFGGGIGAVGAALAGGSLASRSPAALIDAMGEVGQGVAKMSNDRLRESAAKMAADPLKVKRLADLPGAVGNAARWALEKAKDPASFAARLYTLLKDPAFSRAVSPTPDSTSHP